MTDFAMDVYDALRGLPGGCVISYGRLAALAGRPGAARAVGNILHKNPWPDDVPCFRVVHSDGSLAPAFAFGGICRQRELLEADGIDPAKYTVTKVIQTFTLKPIKKENNEEGENDET